MDTDTAAPAAKPDLEMIDLGACPTCGGPAQFIEGGTVRHVDLRDAQLPPAEAAIQAEQAVLRG